MDLNFFTPPPNSDEWYRVFPVFDIKYVHVLHCCSKSLNHLHAEFLKWNNPLPFFGTIYYHFRDIKMEHKVGQTTV